MADAKVIDIRGSAAGVNSTEVVDGQRLYDLENRKLYIDHMVDNTPERVEMSLENTFRGTVTQWNALTDDQKAIYTFVSLSDDYERHSDIFQGATAEENGIAGLVPAPLISDRNSVLTGDGTWTLWVVDDTLSSTSSNPPQNKTVYNALDGKLNASLKGVANGVAELDNTGKVPINQLPGGINLLEKYPTVSDFPATGDDNTMYVALDTNYVYRWTGADYIQIDASIQIGETSQTAFRGDHGKIAYDHAMAKGVELTSGMYKIVTNAEGHITSGTAIAKSDITGLGIPAQDTTYSITDAQNGTYADLTAFVQTTAKGKLVSNFEFTDTNNIFGLGASTVVKGTIQYEHAYDGTSDVKGNGILYLGSTIDPYLIYITGTSTFTLTKKTLTATKASIGLGNVENLNYKKLITYATAEPSGVWNGCVWIA